MIFHGDSASGNCYKIRLLADLLQLEYQWNPIDILAGESKTPEFLKLNANGAIPVLQLPDGTTLAESNAILFYLSQDESSQNAPFWPTDRWQSAQVLRWMFFEQYTHEPNIAVARFINKYLGLPDERRAEFDAKQDGGNNALSVMERQLSKTGKFITGANPTIADISLFAYTHVADEGGFSLESYTDITSWIERIRELPGFVSMDDYLKRDDES